MPEKNANNERAVRKDASMRLTRWVGSTASVIVHTAAFIAFFVAGFAGLAGWDTILLVLTTVVSLEAIYLSIFIQMTVNKNTESLESVEEDLDDLQEDFEDVQEDIEEIQEDMEEIQEDVEEISEDEQEDEIRDRKTEEMLEGIRETMRKLMEDIERLKTGK